MKELPATLLLAPIGFDTLATQVWSAAEERPFRARPASRRWSWSRCPRVLTWLLVLRRAERPRRRDVRHALSARGEVVLVAVVGRAWRPPPRSRATAWPRATIADEPQYLLSALSLGEDRDLDIADELAERAGATSTRPICPSRRGSWTTGAASARTTRCSLCCSRPGWRSGVGRGQGDAGAWSPRRWRLSPAGWRARASASGRGSPPRSRSDLRLVAAAGALRDAGLPRAPGRAGCDCRGGAR